MLFDERKRVYTVYPSWVHFSYKWEDLPRLLAEPLKSGYLDENLDWKSLGYPDEVKPAYFIPGFVGGGIMHVNVDTQNIAKERWLPGLILSKEANWRSPSELMNDREKLGFHVRYLEPRDDPGVKWGLGKKQKVYLCSPTIEQIQSDPEGIYWVVGYKVGSRRLNGLADIAKWARAFDMIVEPLEQIPELVQQETTDWFRNPDYEFSWLRVATENRGAGYNFAVALYIGLHLRFVAGPRFSYMHLLAALQSPVNIRSHWTHR